MQKDFFLEKSEIDRAQLIQLLSLDVPKTSIAKRMGISRMTLYRYLQNNPFSPDEKEIISNNASTITVKTEITLPKQKQEKSSEPDATLPEAKQEEESVSETPDLSDILADLSPTEDYF